MRRSGPVRILPDPAGLSNLDRSDGPCTPFAAMYNPATATFATYHGPASDAFPATPPLPSTDVRAEAGLGVGRRWAPRLQAMGIHTALDLRDAPPDQIGENFGVVLLRTQRELQGRPCAGIESDDPDRSRSWSVAASVSV